jgi:hypothetical protein
VCPPSRFWGEGHTRWRERGWESPNSDEGAYTVIIFIYTHFVENTDLRIVWDAVHEVNVAGYDFEVVKTTFDIISEIGKI